MDTFSGRKIFHPAPPPPPPPHSSHASFPIIAVAIIGIIATGFLLVGYYVFVIKCCLNWHRIDLLRRFSFSRRRRVDATSPTARSPAAAAANRGLTESAIRSIPVFKFKKKAASIINNNNNNAAIIKTNCDIDCAVCLNEFQEDEKLRIIPNCRHLFHIDCIDVWLQNNANCPLCRTSISSNYTNYTFQENQDPIFTNDDVVIEIGRESSSPSSRPVIPERERTGSDGLLTNANNSIVISHSPKILSRKKSKKLSHVWSMGDEWIDNREKDEQFVVNQPMRRSFSMDSAADNHLYLAVQEIIKGQLLQDLNNYQVNYPPNEVCSSSSSSRSIKRSFFSLKGSRSSAVQPVTILEP
ncbi:hypothetical protein MIMGU_mgv1a024693mg [Erythranthe guttata]|uniref:RING-type E3 ubiquitin transferase n=2 Tax=Erythranthe guttata TaxID=4155 RepID=A0A022QDI8_ERYGU|nr:hypothetical protein MIMGU_mgv1a024693mg [Erythranthe guttata]